MRRLHFAVAIAFAVLTQGASARAQGQPGQSVTCSTDPIIFGQQASFTLSGQPNGWMLMSQVWEYQWSVNGCTTDFAGCNANPQFDLAYPGTLTVCCTLTYRNYMGQTTRVLRQAEITVPPPDGLRIVSGDDVSVPFGQFNTIIFQITCKGKDSAYVGTPFAQEQVSNVIDLTTGRVVLPKGAWVPSLPLPKDGKVAFAYMRMGQIGDMKICPPLPGLAAMQAPTGLMKARQDIRVTLIDSCEKPILPAIVLGSFDVTLTKDTQNQQGGTYKFTHVKK